MKQLEEFIIPLAGNKKGVSEFSFELDKSFFDTFEDNEVMDSEIYVNLTLTTGISAYDMHFELKGDVTLECDRCLEPMVQEIEHEAQLIVKLGEKYEEVDDTVVTLGPKDDDINVASFIYEYAKLALPMQRVHDEGHCDEDMLEEIQKHVRMDNDEEEEKETDSRWNALADLKEKMK